VGGSCFNNGSEGLFFQGIWVHEAESQLYLRHRHLRQRLRVLTIIVPCCVQTVESVLDIHPNLTYLLDPPDLSMGIETAYPRKKISGGGVSMPCVGPTEAQL